MVYRPPKKKSPGSSFPANRPSSDPLEGPLSRPASGDAVLQDDDRNLVVVDENYSGGDLEDRLWLFWQRQRGNLLRLLLVACVAVIGWQGWSIYQQHVADKLQSAYQAAEGASGLQAFAQAHPTTTFGKLAQLEAADAFYKDGKFADAAKAYTQAAAVWGSETYGQRARMGLGLSLLQSGDSKGAQQQLESLANDTQAVENYRAEAAFDLAVLAVQAGDKETATKWIEKVKGYKESQAWSTQATTLADMASSLSQLKTTPSGGAPATLSMPLKLTNSAPEAKPATPAASGQLHFDLSGNQKAPDGTSK